MRANIIKVGNSKGLILNKTILEKYKIKSEVNLLLEEDRLVIVPIGMARTGWAEQFAKASSSDEKDELLIPEVFEDETMLPWD